MVNGTFQRLASAIEGARRLQIDELVKLVWRAHAGGELGDNEAQALAELAHARRSPALGDEPKAGVSLAAAHGSTVRGRGRSGARPRRPEHVGRRRGWVASGWLPPRIAALFTASHAAVLAVIASEAAKSGQCLLCNAALANLAGVSVSTVKAAKREAVAAGLIVVVVRRVTAWRNLSNVVRIVSAEWSSWLAHGRKRGGVKSATRFEYGSKNRAGKMPGMVVPRGLRWEALGISVEPERSSLRIGRAA